MNKLFFVTLGLSLLYAPQALCMENKPLYPNFDAFKQQICVNESETKITREVIQELVTHPDHYQLMFKTKIDELKSKDILSPEEALNESVSRSLFVIIEHNVEPTWEQRKE